MKKYLSLNLVNAHLFGFLAYFFLFGFFNIAFGKLELSQISTLTILIILGVLIFISKLYKFDFLIKSNTNFEIFNNFINKFDFKSYLVLLLIVATIISYFYINMENLFAFTAGHLPYEENLMIKKFAKFKHYIVLPILFLLSSISIIKVLNKKYLFLNFFLLILITIFIFMLGRRFSAIYLIFVFLNITNFYIEKINPNRLFKLGVIVLSLSLILWTIHSNVYQQLRINNPLQKDISIIFKIKGTLDNLGSRPSPFYELNSTVKSFEDDKIFFSNGILISQSLKNAIPSILYKDKKFMSEDTIVASHLSSDRQIDFSSNALRLFFLEFGLPGVIYYLISLTILFLLINIILNSLRSNYILYSLYYVSTFIVLLQVETITSNYFVLIFLGIIFFIFNYIINTLFNNTIFRKKLNFLFEVES
ncbi:hypothetical protein [Candidatus Pelagibacter communis]|uniref:hypothetical protein n=1 Tax=Pelagibacter ubique TaxID=198252 RepID=UPI00094D1F33|nr:hypothetical protein [Candidatus Pelagibacter ubique]